MPDSLRRLIERLKGRYLRDEPSADVREEIARRLGAKLRRVSPIAPTVLAQAWHPGETLEAFINRADVPQLQVLLGREVDIRFSLEQQLGRTSDDVLFDGPRGNGIESVRFGGAILFKRPGERVTSWRGPVSISNRRGYPKHLFRRRPRSEDSMYAEGASPRALELAVFRGGRGYFESPERLFLFGSFASPIGTIYAGGDREDTTILKVQLDREPRKPRTISEGSSGRTRARKQGFWTKMHGYPISRAELAAGFPAGARSVLSRASALSPD